MLAPSGVAGPLTLFREKKILDRPTKNSALAQDKAL